MGRSSGFVRLAGVLLVLAGAWGGILPYIGPLFGYPMPAGSAAAPFTWTVSHLELHLLPGLGAILGGLMLIRGRRGTAASGGFLAFLAGAWFVLAPTFARTWMPAAGPDQTLTASTLMQVVTPLGYHYATGLLIAGLGALGLGLASASRGERSELAVAGRPVPSVGAGAAPEPRPLTPAGQRRDLGF